MTLDLVAVPAFARHESFHPRYGWLKKAHDAAAMRESVFNSDHAVVVLGVGKNMVRAIRHWGLATKVLALDPGADRRASRVLPSVMGATLLADDGWDPYCEHSGTLWLLHWLLLAPPSLAPVWWLALNGFPSITFSAEELERYTLQTLRTAAQWPVPHPSSVHKDVVCFLQMYTKGHRDRATFDDALDCPFRDLPILRADTEVTGEYRFLSGDKPTLPPAVLAWACLDFIARTDPGARTATVSRLTNTAGAPGRAFKLTEPALTALLEQAAARCDGMELTSAAGVPVLAFGGDAARVATELLSTHYCGTVNPAARYPSGETMLAGPQAEGPAPVADRPRTSVAVEKKPRQSRRTGKHQRRTVDASP